MLCKSPNDNYKYQVDWTNELGADDILTSTWVVEAGLVNDGDTHDSGKLTEIDVSSGTAGTTYKLTNNITTVGGDIYEREIHIKVQIQLAS